MPKVAEDFKSLLPESRHKPDKRPFLWLWAYDPETNKVEVDHSEDKEPSEFLTHHHNFAQHLHHPDQIRGYAYAIEGGWRIEDDDHKAVEDVYIKQAVREALQGHKSTPPIPHPLYHGDPRR